MTRQSIILQSSFLNLQPPPPDEQTGQESVKQHCKNLNELCQRAGLTSWIFPYYSFTEGNDLYNWLLELFCDDNLISDRYRTINDGGIGKLLCRLVNPLEYAGDINISNNNISSLNKMLMLEGYKIVLNNNVPEIIPYTSDEEESTPTGSQLVFPSFSHLIKDREFSIILEKRCEEAKICMLNGAYVAAIVMMGGMLEGFLVYLMGQHLIEANKTRACPKKKGRPRKIVDWTFYEMINVAVELNWIKRGRKEFSHTLRDYRNLVHPQIQYKKNDIPDNATCEICWKVTQETVNDLINSIT